jgi:8-oxo-dGTP pyrophosphatase MutT (NUDIX family)
VFTRRTETMTNHRGQISLPGGRRDPEDVSLEATALRETEEELGVQPRDVRLLGRLDDEYVIVSNHLIAPFIGAIEYQPVFRPNPEEVAEVIEIPLEALRNPAIYREEPGHRPEMPIMHYFNVGPYEIWGATARILRKFLASDYPDRLAGASPDSHRVEPTRG